MKIREETIGRPAPPGAGGLTCFHSTTKRTVSPTIKPLHSLCPTNNLIKSCIPTFTYISWKHWCKNKYKFISNTLVQWFLKKLCNFLDVFFVWTSAPILSVSEKVSGKNRNIYPTCCLLYNNNSGAYPWQFSRYLHKLDLQNIAVTILRGRETLIKHLLWGKYYVSTLIQATTWVGKDYAGNSIWKNPNILKTSESEVLTSNIITTRRTRAFPSTQI